MLLNSFKLGGFKVFGATTELNMEAGNGKVKHLSENIIEDKVAGDVYRNLKSSIIYGGNNTGKSSLLDGLMIMRTIFFNGNLENFPFDVYKNFCYEYDDSMNFEITIREKNSFLTYGIEFSDEDNIGEYLFENETLLFSRNIDGSFEGLLLEDDSFKTRIYELPSDKLIVRYFLEYTKPSENLKSFLKIDSFFRKILYVNNGDSNINMNLYKKFSEDKMKMSILNNLIAQTNIYLKSREIVSEDILMNDETFRTVLKLKDDEEFKANMGTKESIESFFELLKLASVYEGRGGKKVYKPSLLFDSVGTKKFINLAIHIIEALTSDKILLIDEFDSSIHYKLTRALSILMNSEANQKAQFIMTTHDVKLLSQKLFRKDQINFIVRDSNGVEIVSLDEFKANSETDIRSTSNFENMYVQERIVELPETNVYDVIRKIYEYDSKQENYS